MSKSDTGSTEASVLIYGIQRGEYDGHLWELMEAIKRRRRVRAEAGSVIISRGDFVELVEDLPQKYSGLRSAQVRILTLPERGRVQALVTQTQVQSFYKGRTLRIPLRWIFCRSEE